MIRVDMGGGLVWWLRYRPDAPGYKWEFVGSEGAS